MLHLVKLCVGVDTLEEFFAGISEAEAADSAGTGVIPPWRFRHVTRQTPRRADEILSGGSLYWVISGRILCRQRILGLEPVRGEDGIERCAILLSREAWRTRPAPRRPFQGWRYLAEKDAPPDLAGAEAGADLLPDDLLARLGEFGVL
ncbi:DUF1489 domain-containing protein [Neomegalonema sp.]|uniref:DUF1489 family protein n=1 Tax=Neomegalonema sp. TaxID=2039713 RepID=UPI002616FFE2|nr:DUF1489 domain-containing protein [Neomegalonema sp.]MDD2869427.1 DUF1489 domain-containing protein [Neomegalonema sp.]